MKETGEGDETYIICQVEEESVEVQIDKENKKVGGDIADKATDSKAVSEDREDIDTTETTEEPHISGANKKELVKVAEDMRVRCMIHDNAEYRLYCKLCEQLCCIQCCFESHLDHDVVDKIQYEYKFYGDEGRKKHTYVWFVSESKAWLKAVDINISRSEPFSSKNLPCELRIHSDVGVPCPTDQENSEDYIRITGSNCIIWKFRSGPCEVALSGFQKPMHQKDLINGHVLINLLWMMIDLNNMDNGDVIYIVKGKDDNAMFDGERPMVNDDKLDDQIMLS